MTLSVETWDMSEALAREMSMLEHVTWHPEDRFLWLWTTTQCLAVPRKIAALDGFDQVAKMMARKDWPVHVRGTGGDVTPQGAGIVNVTHVYARPPGTKIDMATEYGKLCGPIEAALGPGASRGWQPGAFCDGAYNVQWKGLKFAGTAMRFRACKSDRTRQAVLAHALMLFEPPRAEAIEALNTFLDALSQGREIELSAHTGLPEDLTPDVFATRLEAEFAAIGPELTQFDS